MEKKKLGVLADEIAKDTTKSNEEKVNALRKLGFNGLEASDIILEATK